MRDQVLIQSRICVGSSVDLTEDVLIAHFGWLLVSCVAQLAYQLLAWFHLLLTALYLRERSGFRSFLGIMKCSWVCVYLTDRGRASVLDEHWSLARIVFVCVEYAIFGRRVAQQNPWSHVVAVVSLLASCRLNIRLCCREVWRTCKISVYVCAIGLPCSSWRGWSFALSAYRLIVAFVKGLVWSRGHQSERGRLLHLLDITLKFLFLHYDALIFSISFLAVLIASNRIAQFVSTQMSSVRFWEIAMVLVEVLILTVKSLPSFSVPLQLLDQIFCLSLLFLV